MADVAMRESHPEWFLSERGFGIVRRICVAAFGLWVLSLVVDPVWVGRSYNQHGSGQPGKWHDGGVFGLKGRGLPVLDDPWYARGPLWNPPRPYSTAIYASTRWPWQGVYQHEHVAISLLGTALMMSIGALMLGPALIIVHLLTEPRRPDAIVSMSWWASLWLGLAWLAILVGAAASWGGILEFPSLILAVVFGSYLGGALYGWVRFRRRTRLRHSLATQPAVPLAAVLIATVLCAAGSGQQAVQPPSARQLGINLAPGAKSRAGQGEALLLQAAAGASPIVRLHCALGEHAIVMLPAGELEIVERIKTQPTSDPFVAATTEAMIESLKSEGLSEFKFVHAKPYLFVYDCSEGFYMHTRSILESLLPGVVASLRSWGQTMVRPATPLVVIILPSRAAFDTYRRVPDEIVAYYNVLTNHIVMYEDQRFWEAAPEFAAKQAAYTIAHEGVHQLLANTGIQSRLSNWPPWICEGLPEYYCPLKVNSNLVRKGNSELPKRTLRWTKAGMVNDLRMYHLLRINAGSGEVLKQLVQSDEIDSEGYALAWGLVHYLASEKPEEFRAYLRDVSQFEPLDATNRPLAGRPDPYFVKHFGDDFAALEQSIQKHLTSRKMQAEYVDPIENQTHYVVKSVEKQGRKFAIQLAITTSPAAARQWKEAEEAANKKATFFTIVCKSRRQAEREVRKLQRN